MKVGEEGGECGGGGCVDDTFQCVLAWSGFHQGSQGVPDCTFQAPASHLHCLHYLLLIQGALHAAISAFRDM